MLVLGRVLARITVTYTQQDGPGRHRDTTDKFVMDALFLLRTMARPVDGCHAGRAVNQPLLV